MKDKRRKASNGRTDIYQGFHCVRGRKMGAITVILYVGAAGAYPNMY